MPVAILEDVVDPRGGSALQGESRAAREFGFKGPQPDRRSLGGPRGRWSRGSEREAPLQTLFRRRNSSRCWSCTPAENVLGPALVSLLRRWSGAPRRLPSPSIFLTLHGTIGPNDYSTVYERWTRHGEAGAGCGHGHRSNGRLYKSWDFRQAYVAYYAASMTCRTPIALRSCMRKLDASRASYEFPCGCADATEPDGTISSARTHPWAG